MKFLYDLGKCPASYDFLQWLINIEIYSIVKGGGVGEAKVAFRAGPKDGFRDDSLARPLSARQAILENVMRPALKLSGAQEIEPDEECIADIPYLPRFAVNHCVNHGGDIPYFRIPSMYADPIREDFKDRKPLVLTLREASYYPERNSNLAAWIEFAKWSKEDVVFVRDTAFADEPIPGFETCPRASRDTLYRAALMRIARCNMFVATGPWNLALYSPSAWFNFGALRPELPHWSPGQPPFWATSVGVPVGRQFPWAHTNQQMIWEHDTLEVLCRTWEQNKKIIDNPPPYKIGDIKTKGVMAEEDRLQQCLTNMRAVKDRLPELPKHDGVAVIACYGPSLQDTYKMIRAQRNHIPNTCVVSVSGSHDFLMKHHIRPNVHVECDPRRHKLDMVRKPHKKTKYYLASCVHPDFVERLKGYEVTLWHLFSGEPSMKLLEYEKDGILTAGGGSVGLRAICLMFQLGYRKFIIHGMDCLFREGEQHAGVHTGKIQQAEEIISGEGALQRTFISSRIQVAYARQFLEMMERMHQLEPDPQYGRVEFALYGDGLLQHMIKVAQTQPYIDDNGRLHGGNGRFIAKTPEMMLDGPSPPPPRAMEFNYWPRGHDGTRELLKELAKEHPERNKEENAA